MEKGKRRKAADLNSNIFIGTLNINGLNKSLKR